MLLKRWRKHFHFILQSLVAHVSCRTPQLETYYGNIFMVKTMPCGVFGGRESWMPRIILLHLAAFANRGILNGPAVLWAAIILFSCPCLL